MLLPALPVSKQQRRRSEPSSTRTGDGGCLAAPRSSWLASAPEFGLSSPTCLRRVLSWTATMCQLVTRMELQVASPQEVYQPADADLAIEQADAVLRANSVH